MKTGIIGLGHVGYPLYTVLKYYHDEVYGYDINKKCDSWDDILETDVTFVCVPTNLNESGRLDNNIVEDTFNDLMNHEYHGLAVVKSTLGLGFINDAIKRYQINIAVFPEWLREEFALPDTIKPEMVVIGTNNKEDVNIILEACPWCKYPNLNYSDIKIVKPEEAVMIKLVANALAATKISFANQIQLICEKYEIDEKLIMEIVKTDPRCSPRYLTPGWSYGKYCLPKDTSELVNCCENSPLLKSVEGVNEIFKRKSNAETE